MKVELIVDGSIYPIEGDHVPARVGAIVQTYLNSGRKHISIVVRGENPQAEFMGKIGAVDNITNALRLEVEHLRREHGYCLRCGVRDPFKVHLSECP